MNLDQKYPHIANWSANGCIEIGTSDPYSDATARAMDEGGVIWETDKYFPTLDAMLDAIERGIADWCTENGVEWEE